MAGIDLHVHLAPALGAGESFNSPGPAALYHPDELEAYLDRAGLDAAVVSLPPPFFRQNLATVAESAAWAQQVNDGLLSAIAGRPKLSALAYLPLEHPTAAIAEYRRITTDARFSGVSASAGGRSISLADPSLDELWRGLNRDSRLLMLHPGTSPDARLEPFYLSNLLGNPVETAVAAGQLIFGDVLPRFPDLRVLLVHCGGCVTSVAGRWQRGVDAGRPGIEPLTEEPAKALRRIYVDALAHDPRLLDHAIEVFGADKIVLGSDWPFPMGTDDPRSALTHRGAEYVHQVSRDNALMALGRV